MSEVILIRPGCTDFDEQNRIQGTLDLPLNPRGREQVGHLIEQLRDMPLQVILTAPCEPARSTAEAIGDELGIPVKEDKRLCNLNQGLWQGLKFDDVRRKYPKVFKQMQESPESVCPPEGETVSEAVQRLRKALEKRSRRGVPFGVVAPEPLATLIRCVLTNTKPEMAPAMGGAPRTDLVEILRVNGDVSAAPAEPSPDADSVDSPPQSDVAAPGGKPR